MEISDAFLGVLVASSGPPEDLLAVKWAPRAVLKGPLGSLVGTSGPSSQEVPSWRSLRDPLGIARGAQERFWATKIVPWNGPGPLPGTKIVILRRFRACPFSSPQTGPIHKETLRGGSGDVWEHHFRPKSSFYEGFGLVAFTYDVASECVFFSNFTNTSYFTRPNGPRRPKPSIFFDEIWRP